MTSGSGYVTGGAPGPKSRGGFEITDGGLTRAGTGGAPGAGACARACKARCATAVQPAAAPKVKAISRRVMRMAAYVTSRREMSHPVCYTPRDRKLATGDGGTMASSALRWGRIVLGGVLGEAILILAVIPVYMTGSGETSLTVVAVVGSFV